MYIYTYMLITPMILKYMHHVKHGIGRVAKFYTTPCASVRSMLMNSITPPYGIQADLKTFINIRK